MKKVLSLVLIVFSLLFLSEKVLVAGEIDLLVDKLVDKGILSPIEAQIVLDETKADVVRQNADVKNSALPSWIQKTKLKGDLRLRFQQSKKNVDGDYDNQGRLRIRLGLESKVTDKVKLGFGIASAGSSNDPRSRNVTLSDTFDTFVVEWDYGFAEWSAMDNLKFVGGKFLLKPYLWLPTDMLWDGDITPEGASVNYVGTVAEDFDYWVNGGVWILDSNGNADAADPFMLYSQGGIGYKHGSLDAKLATTFYGFQGIEDIDLANSKTSQGSNNTTYGSSYSSISPAIEVGIKEPFGGLPFGIDERIAIFAEYVKNLDDAIITDELNGWSLGFKLGNAKVKSKGSWQLKYIKTKLEKDAWLDLLPDSDRFGGKTGIEGHEISLEYVLRENIIFGLDYYKSWELANRDNKENLIQADLVFKF